VWGREKHPFSIWKKMAERHVSFEQITDIFAFRVLTEKLEDCYRALGVLHQAWQFVPGASRTTSRPQDQRLPQPAHDADLRELDARRSADPHQRDAPAQRVRPRRALGLQAGRPARRAGRLAARPDRDRRRQPRRRGAARAHALAIYQDRIFAFTPKGSLFQLPKGATPVDFAFAVHTDLGAQTVGAKINGRHMPLRTPLNNGDVVEIIKGAKGSAAEPQLSWLGFVVTGKARASIRRAVRAKEYAEVAAIGRKLFDQIADRVPPRSARRRSATRSSGSGSRTTKS
jgi:GTP pyrophosphokinase